MSVMHLHECMLASKVGHINGFKWRHISASCIRCARVYREEYPHECDALT